MSRAEYHEKLGTLDDSDEATADAYTDKATLDFIAWLKEQPLLKGILCGHMHYFYEERFSKTAMQYTVGATYNGDAYLVRFK